MARNLLSETDLTIYFDGYEPNKAYYALEAMPTARQEQVRDLLIDYRGRSDEEFAAALGVDVEMANAVRHVTHESV